MTTKQNRIIMTNRMTSQSNNESLKEFQQGLQANTRLYERLSSNDINELSMLFVKASTPYKVTYLGKVD